MVKIIKKNLKETKLIYNKKHDIRFKDFLLKKLKQFNKSLIKYNVILKGTLLKKKKKIIFKSFNNDNNDNNNNDNYNTKKLYKYRRKKYFNTRISLKQYKNNFYAIFCLKNIMRRYYSTGLFYNSGPKKSSTYAAQLVGKLMGRYIKKILKESKLQLKIRHLCLSLKTRRNAFTYACLKGIYKSRLWFGVNDPFRKIPHGYIRLRKPRSL